MSAYNKQHFLQQSWQRNWSQDGKSVAKMIIPTGDGKEGNIIPNCSIRTNWQKKHYYENPSDNNHPLYSIEDTLSKFEGLWSDTVRDIIDDVDIRYDNQAMLLFRLQIALQLLRTDIGAAVFRCTKKEVRDTVNKIIGEERMSILPDGIFSSIMRDPNVPRRNKRVMNISMSTIIADKMKGLSVLLLKSPRRNILLPSTGCFLTNSYALNSIAKVGRNMEFDHTSVGNIIIVPLDPGNALVLIDANAYEWKGDQSLGPKNDYIYKVTMNSEDDEINLGKFIITASMGMGVNEFLVWYSRNNLLFVSKCLRAWYDDSVQYGGYAVNEIPGFNTYDYIEDSIKNMDRMPARQII